MDDYALLTSLGLARPARGAAGAAIPEDAFPAATPRKGERRRLFPERTTIGLMVGQALNRNAPCKDAVRFAQTAQGLADASPSTAAYCKARARVRAETLREMASRLSAMADALCRTGDAPGLGRFAGVWALDGTSFQAADTAANAAEWPYAAGQKPGCGFPVVGMLAAHSLVGGGSCVLSEVPGNAHDFRLFARAAPDLGENCLYVGDRAFCCHAAFALLGRAGAHGIFRGKEGQFGRRREEDVDLGEGDRLTTLRRTRASKVFTDEELAKMPEKITVRVVTEKIRARGFRDVTLVVVTSLLDPSEHPRREMLGLYMRRWEIEVSFRDMKTTLRYEFIRGQSPKTVRLEVGVLLVAYNFMRYVIARGSPGEAKPRRGIASTAAAVKAFVAVVQTLLRAGRSCRRAFARLVKSVARDGMPRRRRKPYVRAVKRRPKKRALLMKPRSEYAPEEIK